MSADVPLSVSAMALAWNRCVSVWVSDCTEDFDCLIVDGVMIPPHARTRAAAEIGEETGNCRLPIKG
jgi:hypothetical protein